MSCDTCLRYWQDVERTKILLQKAEYERDRKRSIYPAGEEASALHEAAVQAEADHQNAMERWHTHWATHQN
jgi:hypothetical protein